MLPRREILRLVDTHFELALRVHLRLEFVHLLVLDYSLEVLDHLFVDGFFLWFGAP